MSTGPRETVYDAEIAPLMTQIIEICKREKVPMIASFQLDGDVRCTTGLLDKDWGAHADFRTAFDMVYEGVAAVVMRRRSR